MAKGAVHDARRPDMQAAHEHQLFRDGERRTPMAANAYAPGRLPRGTERELIDVTASDGAFSFGLLHMPPAGPGGVCAVFMHPRTNQTRPYLAPMLLEAGVAVWGHASRYVNNDTDMTHEEVLLDTAAGMRLLRDRGFTAIVLVGNSGGGSLLSSYQEQATRAPAERLAATAAGEPTGFADEDMPAADHFVALATHPGEGTVLMEALDASMVDESDPSAVDPALDMFASANGYRRYPEASKYDPDWLAAYRAAQRDRCRRIDARAHAHLRDYAEARASADDADLSSPTVRRALTTRYMTVYGTLANPAHLDTSIAPNDRVVGSLFAAGHPLGGSLAPNGLSRVVTARAWLSTWSGLSAHAQMHMCVKAVDVPTLFVYADADTESFPDSQRSMFQDCPAADKTFETLPYAEHYLNLRAGAPPTEDPRERAGRVVADWLIERIDGLGRTPD